MKSGVAIVVGLSIVSSALAFASDATARTLTARRVTTVVASEPAQATLRFSRPVVLETGGVSAAVLDLGGGGTLQLAAIRSVRTPHSGVLAVQTLSPGGERDTFVVADHLQPTEDGRVTLAKGLYRVTLLGNTSAGPMFMTLTTPELPWGNTRTWAHEAVAGSVSHVRPSMSTPFATNFNADFSLQRAGVIVLSMNASAPLHARTTLDYCVGTRTRKLAQLVAPCLLADTRRSYSVTEVGQAATVTLTAVLPNREAGWYTIGAQATSIAVAPLASVTEAHFTYKP